MRISDWSSDVCSSDLAPQHRESMMRLQEEQRISLARIGTVAAGSGLSLCDQDETLELPTVLGWEHGDAETSSSGPIRPRLSLPCNLYNNLQCSCPNYRLGRLYDTVASAQRKGKGFHVYCSCRDYMWFGRSALRHRH